MSAGTFDNDWCNRIINDLLKWQLTTYFRKPVDPDKDGAPSYLEKVKNPIDLSTIKNKLQANEYKTANDFMQDIRLIYKNAETYNGENSMITFIAKDIVKWVEQQFSEKCNSYEEEMRFRLHKAIEELNEHMKHEPPLDINEENAHDSERQTTSDVKSEEDSKIEIVPTNTPVESGANTEVSENAPEEVKQEVTTEEQTPESTTEEQKPETAQEESKQEISQETAQEEPKQ